MEGGIVAWGLSPSLVGLAQKTISETRVPRVSFQRSSFVIAYLVCVTNEQFVLNITGDMIFYARSLERFGNKHLASDLPTRAKQRIFP